MSDRKPVDATEPLPVPATREIMDRVAQGPIQIFGRIRWYGDDRPSELILDDLPISPDVQSCDCADCTIAGEPTH